MLPFAALRGQEKDASIFGDAEAYERFMGRWSRLVAPLLVEFAGMADTGRVLDVRCGTGSLTFAIARLKPRCQIRGIDPSNEYIAYAVRRKPADARATFETGNAHQLRFADATFQSSLSLLVSISFLIPPRRCGK